MRITILGLNYSPEPSGNAPYTAGLAEGLKEAGHKVHVITGYPHYPEWRLRDGYSGLTSKEEIGGIPVTRVRHFIPGKPTAVSRLIMELSFGLRLILANWHSPDVILLVSPALFSSGLALLKAKFGPRRPRVGIWVQDIYSHGVVEIGTGGHQLSKAMMMLEGLILRSCHGVVAIHDRFRDFMVATVGVPASNIRVIRNWTHLPPTLPSDKAAIRHNLKWADNDIIVLHAGNMGQKQGLENVVATARLAGDRQSKVRFVLMGDGNQRRSLEAMAHGIRNLDFVDPLPGDEFQQALAAADILLVNERAGVKDMAVPSKLTSYFNAGVPVVAATDSGSVTASEIEISGGGMRVDAGNPLALLDALEDLSSDPGRSRELATSGIEFRQVTLSKAVAIAHYDEFLSGLVSGRGR